jgi:hypothetical protein
MLTSGIAGYHGANHVDAAPPAPPVAPVVTEMEAMRAEMAAMRVALAAQAALPPALPAAPLRPLPALANMGYCWSHGYSGILTHTSQSCVTHASRHQETATHANKLGGTDRIWTRADRRTPR